MYIGTLPAVSNRATFSQAFEVIDSDTGTGFDLTNATIVYELRDAQSQISVLTASIDLSNATDGIFTASLTDTQMRSLDPKQYDVGCTVEISDEVAQFFAGSQPVVDGIVT